MQRNWQAVDRRNSGHELQSREFSTHCNVERRKEERSETLKKGVKESTQ
jgi:hypothetical protein